MENEKVGFFALNLSLVSEIVNKGGSVDHVMAYLVLCRGAGSKGYSSHGAHSIANRTEITQAKSFKILEWLESNGFIKKCIPTKQRESRYELLSGEQQMIYLSNSLVDGVGNGKSNPPLKRLGDIRGTHYGRAETRLDALMVLLMLYQHQSLMDYGGINPSEGVYGEWQHVDQGEELLLNGSNARIIEIERGNQCATNGFYNDALWYVADDGQRVERFWDAIKNLKNFGWLYETIQIWSDNPIKDEKAEPLYTLYIFDRHVRDGGTEPFLSREIHRAAFRTGSMDGYSQFSDDAYESQIVNSGRFRYVTAKKSSYPIGIYRLKFRPHTQDVGKGIREEQRRFDDWKLALDRLQSQ